MIRGKVSKAGRLVAGEDSEQIALTEWVDLMIPQVPQLRMYAAHANGGARPSSIDAKGHRYSVEGAKLKRMGVRAGYPDVSLMVAAGGFHGLFIELKTATGSARKDQRVWGTDLLMEGYQALIIRQWVPAARAIADYLQPVVKAAQYQTMIRSLPH